MKTKFLLIYFLSGFLFFSCTTELVVDDTTNKDINNLTVPSGFDWKTTKDINFSIKIRDIRFKDALHVISIYGADPKTGANVISKGAASIFSPFYTKISLGSNVKDVYIVKTAPDGSKITQKVTLDASLFVSLSMGNVSSGRMAVIEPNNDKAVMSSVLEESPDCNTECSISINEKTNNKTIDLGNKTICLTGSNYSVNVQNPNGGILKICGTNITVNNFNIQNTDNATIIVTSTGSATFGSGVWTSSNGVYKNFGIITIPNNLNIGGVLTNYGTLKVNGELQSRTKSEIINQGKIIVNSTSSLDGILTNEGDVKFFNDVKLNSSGETVTNNGTLTSLGMLTINTTFTNNNYITVNNMQINSAGIVNNKCQLVVTNNLGIDRILNNNSYVYVGNETRINSTGSVNLYNGALFVTSILSTFDGKITGIGTDYSLFKIIKKSSNLNNGNAPKIFGQVQFAEPSGTIADKFLSNDAKSTIDGGIYIPKTECNEGNGLVPITLNDADKDGIIDLEDNYPNDVSKAFISNSLPSTVAFEDQWPSTGDYDMNDVVLSYKYQIITNASNKVIQIKGNYNLHAAGGSYENGGGVQFNIPRTKIKNFVSSTGGELEAGQDSVVVILYKNSRKELSVWNTIPTQVVAAPKTFSFTLDLIDGPLIQFLGIGNYNPFIWNNTANFGRGFETHLLGKYPTKLANSKLFGTANDNSTSNKYYVTSNGLPWAIEVLTDDFKYPIERSTITSAYWYFATWATSGGVNRTDWYSNTEPGYRYTPFIFNP